MPNIVKIDNEEFDLAAIPPGNVEILLTAAIGHKVRNEAASKVRSGLLSDVRSAKRERLGDKKAELDDEEARGVKFDKDNPDHVALYRAAQREIGEAIRTGKLGEGRGGGAPRMTEAEKRAQALCKRAVLAVLQSPKFKLWYEGGKPITKKQPPLDHVFAFSDGRERTFGDLVESYYQKNRVTVDREVAKALEAERKAAEKAAQAAEGEGVLDF